MAKSDPTKDPKFQQVVRAFLNTPPKPHSEMKIGKKTKAKRGKSPKPKKKAPPKRG